MLDLSVIILTYNEEIHIRRCLENVCPVAKDVFVIDSCSTDRTVEIASEFDNVTVLSHPWPNNHGVQFNWGLDNAPIRTEWILRLDADEYLGPELIERLHRELPLLPPDVSAISMRRTHTFLRRFIKGGSGPVFLTRIFRHGKARSDVRNMDEHIQVNDGLTVRWSETFSDDNLRDLAWWTDKHNGYSIREAADLLDAEFGFSAGADSGPSSPLASRRNKSRYARMPLFLRAFAYFLYRYFVRGGCLEGKEGFAWCFLQGWWYRTLVDAKIYEIKKVCGGNPEKIKAYLADNYKIKF